MQEDFHEFVISLPFYLICIRTTASDVEIKRAGNIFDSRCGDG